MKRFLFRAISVLLLLGAAISICGLASAISVYFFEVRWTTAFNRSTFIFSASVLAKFVVEAIVKSFKRKSEAGKSKSGAVLVEELARVISSFF
jgi:hypothetical protein